MTQLTDKVVDIVKSTYDEMYSEEAKSAQQRGQRIFHAEQRVIQEKPGYKKVINKLKQQGDISKYGIPVGADPVDNEEGYDEDEDTDENYQSAKQIIFKHQTIGGDNSKGGKTKFRRWLENKFIEGSPDLKKAVDGVSGKKKRNMMIRISFMVRKSIARDGLEPGATAHLDNEGNTTEIFYGSGKSWKSKYPKGGYK
jgi:hypothetical protein